MTLHVFTENSQRRVRRKCPYHRQLEYATQAEYYDTVHVLFNCGTSVDAGYGEWTPPPKKKCPIEMDKHLNEGHPR